MMEQEVLTGAIAMAVRERELGGFFTKAVEIAGRMIANKQSLRVSCAKCNSTEVYCCATTYGIDEKDVACICVHICFNCGENIPAADLIWRPVPDEPIRCFHCSRPVPFHKPRR